MAIINIGQYAYKQEDKQPPKVHHHKWSAFILYSKAIHLRVSPVLFPKLLLTYFTNESMASIKAQRER